MNILPLLNQTTQLLANYLTKVLPALDANWWKEYVLPSLSDSQIEVVRRSQVQALSGLDLAALLRVLDQNWYMLADRQNFTPADRNFVKEMQSVRNRWAHLSADGVDADDEYRDLDTLQRFVELIGGSQAFVSEIQVHKRQSISAAYTVDGGVSSLPKVELSKPDEHAAKFKIGDRVCLRADTNLIGVVIDVELGGIEPRYSVFVNAQNKRYYESQLTPFVEAQASHETIPLKRFNAYLSSLQIRHPSTSILYSLNAARIEFIPYQFRPVLKFIRSDRPRMLIADEVGVGKTIEAGLILRELQARRTVNSVLIICPRPLVAEEKWLREMKRFDESFTQLDGQTLRYCINEMDAEGEWPDRHLKTIIPYSLFNEELLFGSDSGKRRRSKGLLSLDPPPRFDLVIVDEAHHVRNQENFNHRAVRFFCDHAEAVLFLTATPIQLQTRDLYVLLNLLRPDLVIDEESFTRMSEPNPALNQAVQAIRGQKDGWLNSVLDNLLQAGRTSWGRAILADNPTYQEALSLCDKGEGAKISSERRVALIRDIEELHTFSRVINRTRRRDIGDFTTRKPETVKIAFTPAQRRLHDALLQTQATIFGLLQPETNINFLMTTIRRQAASSLYGLAPLLAEILTRRLDELSWAEMSSGEFDSVSNPSQKVQSILEDQILSVLEQAESLDPDDPKLEALKQIIEDKKTQPNHRVIVFTSFRHTLHYLHKQLSASGYRVGMIHGGIDDAARIDLRQRFERPKEDENEIDILMFTEVGSEGLDYQFCDCMVNYDLPWNPMRIEQRIGRIDRRGQRSESVAIFNLIMADTVDADIYDRCLLRIGIFHQAIGAGEEILGQISQEIQSIGDNFQLTSAERQARLEQIADNKIRLIQEQSALEQKQRELFGIVLPEKEMQHQIDDASSFWLTPEALQNLIQQYLLNRTNKEQEYILGERNPKTLRLSQDARSALLQDFTQLPRQSSPGYRQWEKYLKGGDPHQIVTFDAEAAMGAPEAALITPLHPLVRQAAESLASRDRIYVAVEAIDGELPPGDYSFAIYEWQHHGLRDDLRLVPVAESPIVEQRLTQLLADSKDLQSPPNLETTVEDQLEQRQYDRWQEARQRHRKETEDLVAYRRQSLEASHQARLALLHEQLAQADNDKIRRMRTSQIAAAVADYDRRVAELDASKSKADITSQPLAFGVIRIKK